MTDTKFTPGPWREGSAGPNGCKTVGTYDGLMVCMIAHSLNQSEQKVEALGNSALIAAAPELYEALECLLYDIVGRKAHIHDGSVEAARIVLAKAKAKGEE